MTIPFLGSARKVRPTLKDLRTLLYVDDAQIPPSIKEMDEETQTRLNELETGSIALVYEGKSEGELRAIK